MGHGQLKVSTGKKPINSQSRALGLKITGLITNFSNMSKKTILDATGLKCPIPVLKLRKALEELSIGEKIILHADDPVAPLDVEHFCKTAGHDLLNINQKKNYVEFLISKN